MKVETIKRYASVIGMRPRIVFEPIETNKEAAKVVELKAA